VLGGGVLAFALAHRVLGFGTTAIAAIAGCFIAAGLLFGMLFEDWFAGMTAPVERTTLLLAMLGGTAVLAVALHAATRTMHLTDITADDWVEHAALNALATSIILHVAIGRRWPFLRPDEEVRR
jgi:hypothetical protein